MQIYISEQRPDANGVIVEFTSHLGNGIGQWEGPPLQPESHTWYCVELEVIEEDFKWGENVKSADASLARLQAENDGRMIIQGKIENIDREEDFCVIRLAQDGLYLLGTSKIPKEVGEYVRIETQRLLLYNENIRWSEVSELADLVCRSP